MSTYTIALMEPHEEDAVTSLMARCFARPFHPIFFIHPESTIVARCEGRIVAGLNIDIFSVNKRVTMGYLGWLYTDSEHRGHGLANQLLTYALSFLKEKGCTDVAGCVEGDNPSSFLLLERHGFAPLSLTSQIKRFGGGMLRVNKHASRFFDMGYFLWHRCLTEESEARAPKSTNEPLFSLGANLLCTLPLFLGLHLPALLGLPFFRFGLFEALLVLLSLLVRDLAMVAVARFYHLPTVYRGWDTAYLPALLLPLLVGLPFPAAGNRYINAERWSRSDEATHLRQMALAANLALTLLLILAPNPFTAILLVLDTLAFAYPFTGFNASRIQGSKNIK